MGFATQIGRLSIVAAAVLAQIVPAPLVMPCDRGCCAATACCATPPSHDDAADGQCPLCRAATDAACEPQPSAPPCHCQLDARQDDAKATQDRTQLDLRPAAAIGVVPATTAVPDASLQSALAFADRDRPVLSRPARILYGVWRN
jgi:hypothetical protein